MKKLNVLLILCLALSFIYQPAVSASGGMPADSRSLMNMEGKYYFLAHNLHGDRRLLKVSSVNYQLRGGLIPWGTEVKVLKIYRNFMTFVDKDSGRQWKYEFHYNSRRNGGLKKHIESVFVENIDQIRKQVKGMSEVDKDGIFDGRARKGMTREAVLIAMGHPPKFANKRELLESREWLYWSSRFNKIAVEFDRKGLVAGISE